MSETERSALLDRAHDTIDELRELVTELTDHTLQLRTEIASLIALIEAERSRRNEP